MKSVARLSVALIILADRGVDFMRPIKRLAMSLKKKTPAVFAIIIAVLCAGVLAH